MSSGGFAAVVRPKNIVCKSVNSPPKVLLPTGPPAAASRRRAVGERLSLLHMIFSAGQRRLCRRCPAEERKPTCGRYHFSAACQSPFNNSSALASSAFAMFRSTSNVKLYANLGASIALINERLIPAFFASSSCDSPRIFRHVEIITPSSFSGFSFPSVIPFPIFCRGKRMICFIRFLAHRF